MKKTKTLFRSRTGKILKASCIGAAIILAFASGISASAQSAQEEANAYLENMDVTYLEEPYFMTVTFHDWHYLTRVQQLPELGTGFLKIEVRKQCTSPSGCLARSIGDLVSAAIPSDKACDRPWARVDISGSGEHFPPTGESEKLPELIRYDFDDTGKCMIHEGQSYILPYTLFEVLSEPVFDW